MAKITVSGVYVIRNTVSGRVYVGSSQNILSRWREHRRLLRKGKHHSAVFQRSWDKHGEAAFTLSIAEVVTSYGALFEREQHWINTLHAACSARGLNRFPTAGGARGFKMSAEARALMSAQRRGRKMPPFSAEHRAAISAGKVGRRIKTLPRTAEHKAAISAANTGRKRSPETRQKMSAQRRGRKMPPRTDEHRAAISAANIGRPKHSPEARLKMSASRKGKKMPPRTDKHRAAISAANMGRRKHHSPKHLAALRNRITIMNQSPEARARTVERNRAPMSEETKEKMRLAWTPERKALLAARNQSPEGVAYARKPRPRS